MDRMDIDGNDDDRTAGRRAHCHSGDYADNLWLGQVEYYARQVHASARAIAVCRPRLYSDKKSLDDKDDEIETLNTGNISLGLCFLQPDP